MARRRRQQRREARRPPSGSRSGRAARGGRRQEHHHLQRGGVAMDLVNPIVRRWLKEGEEDPDGFWSRAAAELPWFRRWDRAFDWEYRASGGSRARGGRAARNGDREG